MQKVKAGVVAHADGSQATKSVLSMKKGVEATRVIHSKKQYSAFHKVPASALKKKPGLLARQKAQAALAERRNPFSLMISWISGSGPTLLF